MGKLRWYKRDPVAVLVATSALDLWERGAFYVITDHIYAAGGKLENNDRYIAGFLGCTTNTWRQIRERLIRLDLLRSSEKQFMSRGHLSVNRAIIEPPRKSREHISADDRKAVFERDGKKCVYCRTNDGPFHLDHVHPASRGGPSTYENLVVACRACNLDKRAQTVEEWRGVR